MLKGFKDFIMRGNVVDLAVAVVIGTAFGKVVDTIYEQGNVANAQLVGINAAGDTAQILVTPQSGPSSRSPRPAPSVPRRRWVKLSTGPAICVPSWIGRTRRPTKLALSWPGRRRPHKRLALNVTRRGPSW